jgi:hypothetical protein
MSGTGTQQARTPRCGGSRRGGAKPRGRNRIVVALLPRPEGPFHAAANSCRSRAECARSGPPRTSRRRGPRRIESEGDRAMRGPMVRVRADHGLRVAPFHVGRAEREVKARRRMLARKRAGMRRTGHPGAAPETENGRRGAAKAPEPQPTDDRWGNPHDLERQRNAGPGFGWDELRLRPGSRALRDRESRAARLPLSASQPAWGAPLRGTDPPFARRHSSRRPGALRSRS